LSSFSDLAVIKAAMPSSIADVGSSKVALAAGNSSFDFLPSYIAAILQWPNIGHLLLVLPQLESGKIVQQIKRICFD
jgi:hypothetical protein